MDDTADLAAKALLEAEWTEHGGPVYSCHGCHHSWSYRRVHAPTCRVDAALTALGYPDRASRDKALRELRDADFKARWAPVVAAVPAVSKVWDSPTPCIQRIPDSPTSDPDFDSDPDDGGD
jgi:hypothetical protein